jgi:hypothetical protein
MDQRPEAGRIEVENGSHKINDGVIVHQPPGHDPEQRFCHRQLADRGRTMDEKQFHAVRSLDRRWSPGCASLHLGHEGRQ